MKEKKSASEELETFLKRLDGVQDGDDIYPDVEDFPKSPPVLDTSITIDGKTYTLPELDQIREASKKDWDEDKKAFENQAKEILMDLINLYFPNLNKRDLINYRLKINSMSLGNLMFQVKLAERILYELWEEISVFKKSNPMNYQNANILLRTYQDFTVKQSEFVYALEKSYQQLRQEKILYEDDEDDGRVQDVEVIESTGKKKRLITAKSEEIIQIIKDNVPGADNFSEPEAKPKDPDIVTDSLVSYRGRPENQEEEINTDTEDPFEDQWQ